MISSRTNGKDSGDRTLDAVSRNTAEQVDKANASGRTPVVFVHGLWLLPSSWDRWAALFDQADHDNREEDYHESGDDRGKHRVAQPEPRDEEVRASYG